MESVISERSALSHCINQSISLGELEIPDPMSIISYAEKKSDAGMAAAEFELLADEVLAKIE